MVDDELVQQLRHDVGVTDHATCDICGATVPSATLALVARNALADQAELLMVCPECRAAIDRGEIDLTEEEEDGGTPESLSSA